MPDLPPLAELFSISYTPVAGHVRLHDSNFGTYDEAKAFGESLLRSGQAQTFSIAKHFYLGKATE